MNSTIKTQGEALTIAYIGYGFRSALVGGLVYDADKFGGEEGILSELVAQAPALDAEWDFRYGEHGVVPNGASFVFSYEIAEPFGEQFAKLLAADPAADPKPLIQEIFAAADPEFPVPDMEAIREAVVEDALDSLANGDGYAADVVRKGFTGIDRLSRTELVRHYREVFDDDELPTLEDDAEKREPAAETGPQFDTEAVREAVAQAFIGGSRYQQADQAFSKGDAEPMLELFRERFPDTPLPVITTTPASATDA